MSPRNGDTYERPYALMQIPNSKPPIYELANLPNSKA